MTEQELEVLNRWISRQRLSYKNGNLPIDKQNKLNCIVGWHWGLDSVWNQKFETLYEYVNVHGNECPTPTDNVWGNWISVQRMMYNKHRISQERCDKLESIEGWVWFTDFDSIWNQKFEKLCTYINTHNKLPLASDDELGWFITKNKTNYKKGTLSQERYDKLESIDGWEWFMDFDDIWNQKFEILKLYISSHKSMPPQSNADIGRWTNAQLVSKRNGDLSQDRVDKLESIEGWVWDVDFDHRWYNQLNKLKHYIEDNGICPPQSNKSIGVWVAKQRKVYKEGKLSNERIQALNSVEGWVWFIDVEAKWGMRFNELSIFIKENNRLPKEGENLAGFVRTQRNNYKNGKIDDDKVIMLESLGDVWYWSIKDKWYTKFYKFKKYMENNDIPPYSNKEFGKWVNKQRQQYKNGKLTNEQIDKLESIDGWYWSRK